MKPWTCSWLESSQHSKLASLQEFAQQCESDILLQLQYYSEPLAIPVFFVVAVLFMGASFNPAGRPTASRYIHESLTRVYSMLMPIPEGIHSAQWKPSLFIYALFGLCSVAQNLQKCFVLHSQMESDVLAGLNAVCR